MMMEMTLKKAGYKTLIANQGKEAIEILSTESIDLIVVDLMMPEMDGLGFLYWLREEARLKIPTLVQTGMVKPDTEKRVMDAGANAVIFKPIKADVLVDKMMKMEALL